MSAVDAIAEAALSLGYRSEAIKRDYTFSDVLETANTKRSVALVAFTQTPPSYRSSAIAAVTDESDDMQKTVGSLRALGAPLLFVVEGSNVALWQVRGTTPARLLERVAVDQIYELFQRHRDVWRPDAIHRAKSIAAIDSTYQLDFVDIGLLPAVEGELHCKLDRLLVDMLQTVEEQPGPPIDPKSMFHIAFRLLAIKVLRDRGNPAAREWDPFDLGGLLKNIENYYSLTSNNVDPSVRVTSAFSAAWECLCAGISFSNVSSEDLAFVYENTLVTTKARKYFGTHSTPRQLAEYAVARMELHRFDPHDLRIYEPFAGAAPFLVTALRHLSELLPTDWSDRRRHEFLVERLAGDEVDSFACEVATLSLILADYPNHNGWRIRERDLFEGAVLEARLKANNIVLCNPPFQDFRTEERQRYSITENYYSKPVAVLNLALDRNPLALGFVLPRSFILEKKFARERRRIETLYEDIELVALPDTIFGVSDVESTLLIARNRRANETSKTILKSTEVANNDSAEFLKSGKVTAERCVERSTKEPLGNLWVSSLGRAWDYLSEAPRLRDSFEIHRGIEWRSGQSNAWSNEGGEGYKKGIHSARGSRQYILGDAVWLDCRSESLRRNPNLSRWLRPKLIANAARISRGPWCFATTLDKGGLVCSQQFLGLWPREAFSDSELLAYAAILNGPLANAFLADRSQKDRFRVASVNDIPIPEAVPVYAGELVEEYLHLFSERRSPTAKSGVLDALLTRIDAVTLSAYDLPLRAERQLLDYFRGKKRPVEHSWRHWSDSVLVPGLTLAEKVLNRSESRGGWFQEVFQPLSPDAAKFLREYGA